MITLNASGGSVTFTFSGNSTYLNDGTITVPVNSLALIIDESDMISFKKANSNDLFVSANIAEFGMTKAELESWFKANAVGSTGGGGGITSGEVQTMIDESISGKADSSAVTEEISAAVSGKVNVSDNIVSAHTFNARSAGNSYFTKLKFNGRDFSFNDFHSKKISVFPFGGINGQLFTSLYVEGPDYTSYDAAAYLSGSTSDDYPSSFTSVTWTGDETKMKVEINSEGYLDLIAQGEYWFGAIASNVAQELYVNILNDIASGQSASVINDSIVNNLENLGNTINGIQYEINGKLDASAYTPINVDSTLSQASANPIQNKSLFNELRVSGASSGETTIVFVNGESTNYPEGVTVIKFEPTQSNTWASYEFYNGSSYLGGIQVSYYGNISVELSLDGATYTTSGNTVILTVPSTLGITKIAQLMGEYSNFTVKVENPPIYTTLKDVVNGKANQSDFTAYTADTTPKVDGAWANSIKSPSLYYDYTSGITLSSLPISGGNYNYSSIATDASINANNGVLGVYTTGATHAVIKNYSVISNRININSIPSNIKMYWNLSYTGNTSHNIAVSCTVNDGTNGYCQWDWENNQYVPNDKYINTAVTLSYDSTNQVVTITPSSSSALTSIIYVRCNRNIAPANDLTNAGCRIGAVTIDTNSYKLQEALDNKVDTSTITTAVTSGSTDVLTSGGAYEQFGGLKIVKLTESEYAALVDKDPNVLYVVIPDPTNP